MMFYLKYMLCYLQKLTQIYIFHISRINLHVNNRCLTSVRYSKTYKYEYLSANIQIN